MNARGTGTRYLLAAVVVAALAIGAGCSSDSKSKDASTTTSRAASAVRTDSGTSEADLKAAATTAAAANLDGSADTYAYLSASCKAKFSESDWLANERQIAQGLQDVLPAMKTAKVGTVSVRNVTPVAGEVQVIVVDSGGAELVKAADVAWTPWVVEDGKWVSTVCPAAKELLGGN